VVSAVIMTCGSVSMEPAGTSETLIPVYQTTCIHSPKALIQLGTVRVAYVWPRDLRNVWEVNVEIYVSSGRINGLHMPIFLFKIFMPSC
jgi:hypothetical protein